MAWHQNLQDELVAILGTRNVYFQPPDGTQLKYPCIVYERSDINVARADNYLYKAKNRYSITVIDRRPDNTIVDTILRHFTNCRFDRHFVSDNLNHDVITLFY